MHPYYVVRMLGGLLYLTGALLMAFNLWKTMTMGEAPAPAPALARAPSNALPLAAE
jgi:cytochrome c oxidase cbb3-type subunit 1